MLLARIGRRVFDSQFGPGFKRLASSSACVIRCSTDLPRLRSLGLPDSLGAGVQPLAWTATAARSHTDASPDQKPGLPPSGTSRVPIRKLKPGFETAAGRDLGKRGTRHIAAFLAGLGFLAGVVVPYFVRPPGNHRSNQERARSGRQWTRRMRQGMSDLGHQMNRALETMSSVLQERVLEVYFPQSTAPLLPDAADLKHPPNFPTLVVDLDKVLVRMEHDFPSASMAGAPSCALELNISSENSCTRTRSLFGRTIVSRYSYGLRCNAMQVAQDICLRWGLPVVGALHRDNCKRRAGHYVKDLSRLGRRLDRVIILDHDPHAFALQPDNGILIREFDGNPADTELYRATEFLKAAALAPNTDIRGFLQQHGSRDASMFRRWEEQRLELEKKVCARFIVGQMHAQTESRRQFASRIFGARTVRQNVFFAWSRRHRLGRQRRSIPDGATVVLFFVVHSSVHEIAQPSIHMARSGSQDDLFFLLSPEKS